MIAWSTYAKLARLSCRNGSTGGKRGGIYSGCCVAKFVHESHECSVNMPVVPTNLHNVRDVFLAVTTVYITGANQRNYSTAGTTISGHRPTETLLKRTNSNQHSSKRSKNFDRRPNRRQKFCAGVKIVTKPVSYTHLTLPTNREV